MGNIRLYQHWNRGTIGVLSQGCRSHRIFGGHKRRLGVWWSPGSGSLRQSPPEAEAFCETTHNICVKIGLQQTTVTVTLQYPRCLAVTKNNDILVANTGNNRILLMNNLLSSVQELFLSADGGIQQLAVWVCIRVMRSTTCLWMEWRISTAAL